MFDWLRRGRRRDAELREELEFHLEAEARDRGAGVDARNAARRDLGNPTLLYEDVRSVWSWTTIEQLGQDVGYAVRTMAANRGFTPRLRWSGSLSASAPIRQSTASWSRFCCARFPFPIRIRWWS